MTEVFEYVPADDTLVNHRIERARTTTRCGLEPDVDIEPERWYSDHDRPDVERACLTCYPVEEAQPEPAPAGPQPELFEYRFRLEMVSEAEVSIMARSKADALDELHDAGWADAEFDLVESYVDECIEMPANNPLDEDEDEDR